MEHQEDLNRIKGGGTSSLTTGKYKKEKENPGSPPPYNLSMASFSTKASVLTKAIADLLKNATEEEQATLMAVFGEKIQTEGQTVTASTKPEDQEIRISAVVEQEGIEVHLPQRGMTKDKEKEDDESATSLAQKRKATTDSEDGNCKKKASTAAILAGSETGSDEPTEQELGSATSRKDGGKDLSKRKVIPDLVIDDSILESLPAKFPELVYGCQGWEDLFKTREAVDEELVREFYSQLSVSCSEGSAKASVVVQGAKWSFNDADVARLLKIPNEGRGEYPRHVWPENKADILDAVAGRRLGGPNLVDAGMGTIVKAIRHVIVKGITPRMEKSSSVHVQEACLIFDILMKKKVKLGVVIIKHMQSCVKSKNHGLPYPRLVKMLLVYAGLYMPTKEVTLIHRFDAMIWKKMIWGVNTERSELAEIELKMDTLAERCEEVFGRCDEMIALMRKIVARLPPTEEEIKENSPEHKGTRNDQVEGEETK